MEMACKNSISTFWSKYKEAVEKGPSGRCNVSKMLYYFRMEMWYNAYVIKGGKRGRLEKHKNFPNDRRTDVIGCTLKYCLMGHTLNRNGKLSEKEVFDTINTYLRKFMTPYTGELCKEVIPCEDGEKIVRYCGNWHLHGVILRMQCNINDHVSVRGMFTDCLLSCIKGFMFAECRRRDCNPVSKSCREIFEINKDINLVCLMLSL